MQFTILELEKLKKYINPQPFTEGSALVGKIDAIIREREKEEKHRQREKIELEVDELLKKEEEPSVGNQN